jgi:hypothetical protein
MVARGVDPEGVDFGPHKIPQVRYVTEAGLTVAGIIKRFEAHTPELASAYSIILA